MKRYIAVDTPLKPSKVDNLKDYNMGPIKNGISVRHN